MDAARSPFDGCSSVADLIPQVGRHLKHQAARIRLTVRHPTEASAKL